MIRISRRALPLSAALRRTEARALAAVFVVLVVLLAFTATHAAFGLGGRAVEKPIRDWFSSVMYIAVAAIVGLRALRGSTQRVPWGLFAVGLSLYGLGNVLWSLWIEHLPKVPIPSISDGLWLALYPLSYVGIVRLARIRGHRRLPAGVWLDGLIAGAGLAALGAALVFRSVLASTTGSPVAVAIELAYPIGDLVLASLVVGVLALRGWRLDRTWGLLAGGFLLLAVADCMYAVQVAGGSSSPSSMTNFCYVFAVVMLAFAAWQVDADVPQPRLDRWSILLIPAAFAVTALGLLFYDHWHRLDPLALALAMVTLLAAIVRMALAFKEARGLAEIRRQAVTDDLTSLPNRRLFMRRTAAAISDARVTGGSLSLLMMDLDNFKELNDTLGHHAGDTLLRLIGPRIKQALRVTDTVARLGGDEFVILLDPQPERKGIIDVAEKVLSALHEPFDVQGLSLCITASVGIASFPADADDADRLVQRADVAMYLAKSARSGYEFYARDRDTYSRERLAVAGELALALEQGGIEVHYQPKVSTHSRRIVGVEALVRWRREDGSLMAPDQFVDAAEHAGLSRALTRKVLELALAKVASWRSAGHTLNVAVNTTIADLLDIRFPGEVAAALEAQGLPPDALILEITEGASISDARVVDMLATLAEVGVELSLDDFGTGYSSLAHLRTLPVSELKVDRSFVTSMCTDATDAAIVYATIQLAHRLGIRVVAEGVEDQDTWDALAELECELIQGYVVSRPVPAADLERQLNAPPAQRSLELPRTIVVA